MIELVRLDERLIHGKVATSWANSLPIDSIIVVDDDVVKDPFSMKSLQMAASVLKNVKTFIKSSDDALKILCDSRCKDRHVFVVVRQLSTALKICEAAPGIKGVNLGNYGRMMSSYKPRTAYFPDLCLNEDEAAIAKKITELNLDCPIFFQDLPGKAKTDLRGFFK